MYVNVPLTVKLPPNTPLPDTFKSAPVTKLPVTLAVPDMFAPVPVTTRVVLPTAVRFIFPLALGMLTLLLPFACDPSKLPPVILAVVVIVFAPAAIIPMILPPVMLPVAVIKPAVSKLPTIVLPVTLAVPVMLAPVPVTTNVVLPTAVILTLPLAEGMFTLLFPLLILLAAPELTVDQDKLPAPSVCRY